MRKTILAIYLLFTSSTFGCPINNWDVERYRRKFEIHRNDFDKLVASLNTANIKAGYSIDESELPEAVQSILEELEVHDVNLDRTHCSGILHYQFTSSWCEKATLYFSKDACNKEQTE
ncbi:hypothetical protein V9K67_25750 [Paraflavisolibacter sp. H34]|uniref:hypothetical protein n=1 Tax=Huijunlia imazamoxiresistens TaxID=3127457 RepID=UPI0030188C9E